MDPLVVEAVLELADLLLPVAPEIQVVVVFSDHEADRHLQFRQDLEAVVDLHLLAELRQVAAEDDEIGLRPHQAHLGHGLDQALVEVGDKIGPFDVGEMGVRNTGKGEFVPLLFAPADLHQVQGQHRARHQPACRSQK